MTPSERVVFIGSKELGLHALEAIHTLRPGSIRAAITYDDSADGRSALIGFVAFGKRTGVPVLVAPGPKAAERLVLAQEPDLCLVVCWYWLLSDKLLASVPNGIIGVHNSLLPKYRGGSPLVWSIINGEPEVGFTLFSFTHEMDAGAIWCQQRIPLGADADIGEVLAIIEGRLLASLRKEWCDILDGRLEPQAQDESQATYCAQRTPGDGRIDWTASAVAIVNFIRAQAPPYPGAFTLSGETRIAIHRARAGVATYYGRPGQVARIVGDSVLIVCGDNRALEIDSVWMSGVERPARDAFPSITARLE